MFFLHDKDFSITELYLLIEQFHLVLFDKHNPNNKDQHKAVQQLELLCYINQEIFYLIYRDFYLYSYLIVL